MAEGMTIDVRRHGAIVEGHAPEIVDMMLVFVVEEVADYAKFEVLMTLHEVLQHPTGFYQSQITDQTVSRFLHRIHDNGVVYGPWLEGVGSRNYPVTRFKGYHTFRVVKNRMAQKVKSVISAYLERTLPEL